MASNDPRRAPRVTARPFLYTFGPACGSYSVTVPEGVLLRPIEGEPGFYFVEEFAWLEGRDIVRHDAVHYGIRVPHSATRERGTVPRAARFEPETRTIRSVPENYWLASANSWDGAVAHDATCTALAAGLGFLHRVAEHKAGAVPAVELAALIDEARAILAPAAPEPVDLPGVLRSPDALAMLRDALDVLQPDGDEAEALRLQLLAIFTPAD